jgi:hypothetical protein
MPPLYRQLLARAVTRSDADNVVAWWLFSKPGETMLLCRHPGQWLRVDHDGNVSDYEPTREGARGFEGASQYIEQMENS